MNNHDRVSGFGQHHDEAIFPKFIQLLRWLKPAKSSRSSWYYGAILIGAALSGGAQQAPIEPGQQWSRAGFGKRYLRINEYLFNGTQKVTAIAWQKSASETKSA